jgi:hypothetical protein
MAQFASAGCELRELFFPHKPNDSNSPMLNTFRLTVFAAIAAGIYFAFFANNGFLGRQRRAPGK